MHFVFGKTWKRMNTFWFTSFMPRGSTPLHWFCMCYLETYSVHLCALCIFLLCFLSMALPYSELATPTLHARAPSLRLRSGLGSNSWDSENSRALLDPTFLRRLCGPRRRPHKTWNQNQNHRCVNWWSSSRAGALWRCKGSKKCFSPTENRFFYQLPPELLLVKG